MKPVVDLITDGLAWAYEHVLLPFAKWTIEDALPKGLEAVAKAFDVLREAIFLLKPLAKWIWDYFLQPLAEWGGETVVDVLEGVGGALEFIANLLKTIRLVASAVYSVIKGDFSKAAEYMAELDALYSDLGQDKVGDSVPNPLKDGMGVKVSVTDFEDNIDPKSKILDDYTGYIDKQKDRIPKGDKVIGDVEAQTNKLVKGPKFTNGIAAVEQAVSKITRASGFSNGLGTVQQGISKIVQAKGFVNGIGSIVQEVSKIVKAKNFTGISLSGTASYNAKKTTMTVTMKELGGAFFGGKWHNIPQYAEGGLPSHGSMFIAGENGSELVGHIGGRTEVLNQSQLASAMASSMQMAVAPQNRLLQENNALMRELIESQGNIRAFISSGDLIDGIQKKNRRDGRTVVPLGV